MFKGLSIRARGVVIIATLTIVLFGASSAAAHGTYPSEHYAAATCRETPITGQWAVSSNVYMNRANGFDPSVYGTSVGTGPYFTGGSWTLIESHSQQSLYYRVAVGTQDRYGTWTYKYGTWMRRADQLGDHTSGLDTEVETYPGSGIYVKTGYGATGAPEDVSMLTGRIGDRPRQKYIWGQMWWGPIYNSKNQQVFSPYTHWEPIGYVNCG